MARPRKTLRTVYFNVGLPEDLAQRIEAELHSTLEGKAPLGAKQEFFTMLVRAHFDRHGVAATAQEPLL
jgi:hypothetical protein